MAPIILLAALGAAAFLVVKNKEKVVRVAGRSGNNWLVKIHPNQTVPNFDVFADNSLLPESQSKYVLTYSQPKDSAIRTLVMSSPASQALLMAALADFSIFAAKKNTGTPGKGSSVKRHVPPKKKQLHPRHS